MADAADARLPNRFTGCSWRRNDSKGLCCEFLVERSPGGDELCRKRTRLAKGRQDLRRRQVPNRCRGNIRSRQTGQAGGIA
jgi:hypothetical protein